MTFFDSLASRNRSRKADRMGLASFGAYYIAAEALNREVEIDNGSYINIC